MMADTSSLFPATVVYDSRDKIQTDPSSVQ